MTRFSSDVSCVADGLITLMPTVIGLVFRIFAAFAARSCFLAFSTDLSAKFHYIPPVI